MVTKKELPSLELRTAYTQKGLGIGLGGFVGQVLGGPYIAIVGGLIGWYVGNNLVIEAERKYLSKNLLKG